MMSVKLYQSSRKWQENKQDYQFMIYLCWPLNQVVMSLIASKHMVQNVGYV